MIARGPNFSVVRFSVKTLLFISIFNVSITVEGRCNNSFMFYLMFYWSKTFFQGSQREWKISCVNNNNIRRFFVKINFKKIFSFAAIRIYLYACPYINYVYWSRTFCFLLAHNRVTEHCRNVPARQRNINYDIFIIKNYYYYLNKISDLLL